jgi:hypothetical protein
VTWEGDPPVAGIVQSSAALAYTIVVPSGDQSGDDAAFAKVNCVGGLDPSDGTDQSCLAPAYVAMNTIVEPSGDHAGSRTCAAPLVPTEIVVICSSF